MRMKNNNLPILGIGIDVIEIDRFRKSMETYSERLLLRLFTEKERAYCGKYRDPVPHFAVRFAGKEAIAKALGCGFGKKLSWQDLEIFNDASGKPEVHCSDKLNEEFNSPSILLSLSHSRISATAVALWI
jgi:holo-[acyl-carrier protein] synthase